MMNCTPSCKLESYTNSLSLLELVDKEESITGTGGVVRRIEFNVYFEQFEETAYTQVSTVTFDSVVGEIGGSMGMFLGASFVTCVELILFLVQLVQGQFKKLIGRVSPAEDLQGVEVVSENKKVCHCQLPHSQSDT